MGRHAAEQTTDDGPAVDAPVDIVFVTRAVSAEESAAVTAVVTGLLQEESAQAHAARAEGPSAWERSQRGVRSPLDPGPGRWRGFSG